MRSWGVALFSDSKVLSDEIAFRTGARGHFFATAKGQLEPGGLTVLLLATHLVHHRSKFRPCFSRMAIKDADGNDIKALPFCPQDSNFKLTAKALAAVFERKMSLKSPPTSPSLVTLHSMMNSSAQLHLLYYQR